MANSNIRVIGTIQCWALLIGKKYSYYWLIVKIDICRKGIHHRSSKMILTLLFHIIKLIKTVKDRITRQDSCVILIKSNRRTHVRWRDWIWQRQGENERKSMYGCTTLTGGCKSGCAIAATWPASVNGNLVLTCFLVVGFSFSLFMSQLRLDEDWCDDAKHFSYLISRSRYKHMEGLCICIVLFIK